jgi:drug/metabolite transporter (DMT)-like permease
MAIVLGLLAALTYGAADFLGGLATKTTRVFSVVLVSQILGSTLLLVALPFVLDSSPTAEALTWGALAGVAGAVGVAAFYQALSIGRMGVIAPITGVEAATVPVVYGLLEGERPSGVALTGVVLALVAVALVSSSSNESEVSEDGEHRLLGPGVLAALGAGLAFGAFFILLDRAGDAAGLWPLVGARASSVATIAVAVLATRSWDRPSRGALLPIAGAGVLDVSANLLYLLATREGLLSIVAVLTSMYPASTVVLARITLDERFSKIQIGGLLVAVAGVVAIAAG